MPESYNYRIDRDNILVSVSGNWDRFSAENAGADSVSSSSEVSQSDGSVRSAFVSAPLPTLAKDAIGPKVFRGAE